MQLIYKIIRANHKTNIQNHIEFSLIHGVENKMGKWGPC